MSFWGVPWPVALWVALLLASIVAEEIHPVRNNKKHRRKYKTTGISVPPHTVKKTKLEVVK